LQTELKIDTTVQQLWPWERSHSTTVAQFVLILKAQAALAADELELEDDEVEDELDDDEVVLAGAVEDDSEDFDSLELFDSELVDSELLDSVDALDSDEDEPLRESVR